MIGRTQAEANAKFDALMAARDPAAVLRSLSSYASLGIDLAGLAMGARVPLPEHIPETNSHKSRQKLLVGWIRHEQPTVQELYTRWSAGGHRLLVGTPLSIADDFQQCFEAGACDGFNVMFSSMPGGIDDFCQLVVPELQSRGLFRTTPWTCRPRTSHRRLPCAAVQCPRGPKAGQCARTGLTPCHRRPRWRPSAAFVKSNWPRPFACSPSLALTTAWPATSPRATRSGRTTSGSTPLGVHFSQMKVSDLLLVNHHGEIVQGKGPLNRAAFAIHAALHEDRPDIVAAAHTHSTYGKAWAAFGQPLQALTQDSCVFYQDHGVYEQFHGVVNETGEGHRIGQALGGHKAVILKNHGILTWARRCRPRPGGTSRWRTLARCSCWRRQRASLCRLSTRWPR